MLKRKQETNGYRIFEKKTMAFLSLQETVPTQSGQRQFKVLSTESLNGYSKVAQYATHFVRCVDIAKIQLMCGFDTFTYFTLFENVTSPYYLGNAAKLLPAEGLIFFMELEAGFFKVLDGYSVAATHFMWTMLATACEMRQKSDQETVYPAEFLSVFKKNAHERSVLEPIDKLPQQWRYKDNTPVRTARFVISFKFSVTRPGHLVMLPIMAVTDTPKMNCDYYLEGTNQKQMELLSNKFRWNSRTKDMTFSTNDIMEIVKNSGVQAHLCHKTGEVFDDIEDTDDETTSTYHAAAQIIAEVKDNADLPKYVATEAEIADVQSAAIESNMWYLFFRSKFYDGATHLRSAFIEDSPDVDRPELYWITKSADKTLLEAIFKLTLVYMKLPELIENLGKNGLTLESCSSSPSSPPMCPSSPIPVEPEPHSPASPPPALFDDIEPESPPENEVIYIMIDHDSKNNVFIPVRQIRGPVELSDFAYDHEYYLRFPDMGDGLDFFAKYQNKPLERAEIEADLKCMYVCPGGLQELPKIDDYVDISDDEDQQSSDDSGSEFEKEHSPKPVFAINFIQCQKQGRHNSQNEACLQISDSFDLPSRSQADWVCSGIFEDLNIGKQLYNHMKSWNHISIDAFKRQLNRVSDGKVTFIGRSGENFIVPKNGGFSGMKRIYRSVQHYQENQASSSVDDAIVGAVLEVASRKRTDRCSDTTPVSQPKRARGRRMTEIERLRADAVAFKLVPQ